MMVTSQSFRVTGKQEVQDIICDNVDGQNVVFWDDITYVFPEALHVKIGNTVVSMVRDSNRQRIQPLCIKHFPGVVLDVVLSTSSSSVEATTMSSSSLPGNDPTNAASTAPLDIQTEGNSSAPLSVTITANEMIVDSEMSTPNRPDPEPSTGLTINATIPSDHAAKHASVSTPELSVNEQLSMLQDEQTQIRSLLDRCHSLARAIWNDKAEKSDQLNNLYMRYLEGLKSSTAQLKELQKALEDTHTYDPGQLALLQRRIQTVLSQNHKIYENTAPRLFIVLPQDIQHWNSKAPFSNKFRLHFLCDCGEHTKPASSTTPHHIHFAKHEGYDISRLKEFFWRYGTHVLAIMKMLKFGISSTGVTVRPVSQLTNMDIVGRDAESLEGEMDQVIDCIEKITMDQGVNHAARVSEYLWQLDAFLTRGDDEEFGNLFRIVNAEGYFRWICVDHFRGIYPEKEAEGLCAILKSPTDLFQERYGRVVVTLDSREKADQFYQEFGRVKSIYYLDIEIRWDMITRDDLKKLQDTLDKTNVSLSIMDMSLPQEEPTTDHSNDDDDTQLCDLLFDIMGHANIRSFAMFNLPKEFFQQASLLSHDRNFSNLRLLNIGAKHLDTGPESMDIPGLKKMLSKATNLGSFTLNDLEGDPLQIYSAIVEYQTFPFYIPGQFVILARTNEGNGSSSSSSQPMDTIMDREELLRVHGGRIETLNLCKIKMDESTLKALAESIKDNSSLTELRLPEIDPSVWESCGWHLAIIVSRSDLNTLAIRFGGGEAGVQLLESVQWNCIFSLEIRMDNVVRLGTRIMEVSLDKIRYVPGRPLLDDFALYSDCSEQVTDQMHGLLQSFLKSISLHRELCLHVTLTVDQICTLLKSMNLSKVRCLSIRAKGFGMAQVEVILKALEHAAKLRKVTLLGAKHTAGQRKRMEAKGIQLQ